MFKFKNNIIYPRIFPYGVPQSWRILTSISTNIYSNKKQQKKTKITIVYCDFSDFNALNDGDPIIFRDKLKYSIVFLFIFYVLEVFEFC